MKTINTLIPDIYALLESKEDWFDQSLKDTYSGIVAARLQDQLGKPSQRRPTLRLSRMGPMCPKALWHSIHTPELAQPIPPWVNVKFAFGHMVEALAIILAKASGHSVVGEQDEVILDGVVGHRDCVVDGAVVDVKSCSSISFSKLKSRTFQQDDAFGYLDQLDGYVVGSSLDPLVTVKDRGYILAIDKQLGHMCCYEHEVRVDHIQERIRSYKSIVARDNPPGCTCGTRESGKSGNIELDVRASYNPFRFVCHPNLRTFLYAHGPTYLTKVVRKPDVPEVDRLGQIVYN